MFPPQWLIDEILDVNTISFVRVIIRISASIAFCIIYFRLSGTLLSLVSFPLFDTNRTRLIIVAHIVLVAVRLSQTRVLYFFRILFRVATRRCSARHEEKYKEYRMSMS